MSDRNDGESDGTGGSTGKRTGAGTGAGGNAGTPPRYVLDEQVGFLMRRANQRHLAIFARAIPDLTPMQFAALARLCEHGRMSQNALGRATSMDAATIKGVVDRLRGRGLVESRPDPEDQRRVRLAPTARGRALFARLRERALRISDETLAPLDAAERETFLRLLARLG